MSLVPRELWTQRLYLRRWRETDSALLGPVLEQNTTHLRWIPPHIAAPAPHHELCRRLAGFAEDFDAQRAWRFGIFSPDQHAVFGEADLFPRAAAGRVPFADADGVEIGYWLRADVTGLGYATEAARALMNLASGLPGIRYIEIRCDPRNAPSAAVPRRLGFLLRPPGLDPAAGNGDSSMVWFHEPAPD